MNNRKTKGSSMLFVLIFFGIVSILGTSIVGVTYTGYSTRIKENNKIKNLYSAESGIEQAYLKLSSVIDSAISEGISEVNKLEQAGVVDVDKKNDKFKEVYAKYIFDHVEMDVSGDYPISTGQASILCDLYDKADESKGLTEAHNDKIAELSSNYVDSKGNNRSVKVSYTLSVPENIIEMNQTAGSMTAISGYSIVTDKNLEIQTGQANAQLTVDGNVWVKGSKSTHEEISTNPLVSKYSGGLVVDTTGKVYFSGNIATNSNIVVKKGNISTKDGQSVLAENLYLGSLDNYDIKNNTEFNGTNLYLANDLVIADTDAKVSLKNLYAFNDLNTDGNNKTNGQAARESSSIIINSLKWPNATGAIDISDSAYIMGLAYIKTNTDTPYQTGESVAYKGNYAAYTDSIDDGLTDGQYTYLDPLMLLTHNNEGEVIDAAGKTDRFIKYSESTEANKLRTSGIRLPNNTYTAGAYISDNNVLKTTTIVDTNQYKKDYVNRVNYMGKSVVSAGDSNLNQEFMNTPSYTVENQVNWDGVATVISAKGNVFELSDAVVILNKDADKEIAFINKKIKLGGNDIAEIKANKKYIIVTAGQVTVNSTAADSKCSIIAKKDIVLKKKTGKIGIEGGIQGIYDGVNNEGKVILDMIFAEGDTVITTKAITSSDIIEKEKWSIEK